MTLVLEEKFEVNDGSNLGRKQFIPPGKHEIEKIANPFGYKFPWLVLTGTKIGAAAAFFQSKQGVKILT